MNEKLEMPGLMRWVIRSYEESNAWDTPPVLLLYICSHFNSIEQPRSLHEHPGHAELKRFTVWRFAVVPVFLHCECSSQPKNERNSKNDL